jgi:hypothetical protein
MWTIQAAWERCRNITRTLQGRHRVGRHDAQRASSRPPQSQALWVHAREARGEAAKCVEEFALLLEEAALLLEETALVVGESHQLLEVCHE